MSRRTLATVVSGSIVLGMLGARAVHVAGVADFVPGIVHSFRTRFELRSVTRAWRTPAGLISMLADLVRPGHADVGFFKLGPSTFLAVSPDYS